MSVSDLYRDPHGKARRAERRYNEALLTGASQALLDRLHADAERWRAAIQAEQDENHQ